MNHGRRSGIHSARADMFQREATWRLGTEALERGGGEPATAPWWAHVLRFYLRLIVPFAMADREGGQRPLSLCLHQGIANLLRSDPIRLHPPPLRCPARGWSEGLVLFDAFRVGDRFRGSGGDLCAVCARAHRCEACGGEPGLPFPLRQAAVRLLGRACASCWRCCRCWSSCSASWGAWH